MKGLSCDEILSNIDESGYSARMLRLQNRQLYSLLSSSRLERMIDTEIIHPDTYGALEMVRDLRTPFGGLKQSGYGKEGGEDALRFFTEQKNICIQS